MTKLLRETAVACLVFAALSFVLRIGMEPDDGWATVALNAVVFAVFYFIVGLVIRYFKGNDT